ncbi:hypothetical protein V6N11_019361 [Hibiscus sabdariffa]|uniref:Uncharacterized protein n=2 Tax=Hibiscus sabdariffa TaxID=183260 RepID=A0ABR1ZTW3_9ROSI
MPGYCSIRISDSEAAMMENPLTQCDYVLFASVLHIICVKGERKWALVPKLLLNPGLSRHPILHQWVASNFEHDLVVAPDH